MEEEVRARIAALVSEPFELSRLDTRWLALGSDVVAFAADTEAEWRRLQAERWLIERWRAAGVPAPRVRHEDATRGVQLRERLHGLFGPQIHTSEGGSPLYANRPQPTGDWIDNAPLSPFGERVATSYGELAARIRRAVSVGDASAAGLGTTSRRDLDVDDLLARLDATDASSSTKAAARRARSWLEAIPAPDAVIHGDLHFFNMVTAEDGTITGVFDIGDAGIDNAAAELLYVHSLGPQFVARVLEAYGDFDLEEVRRAHARIALGHLIWHPPGDERHPQIIAWVTAVLERLV
jgi:hypothetical protein